VDADGGVRREEAMRARSRDVAVVVVLIVAGALAVAIWHPYGRWPALVVALAGLSLAAGIYRARPSAFPLHGKLDAVALESPALESTPAERS
jgi:hypothetical protein